ncbi:hypothetical protein COW36_16370 [bacterium (Candidatus Blackallbacteria) CG17_big_fil_post_rev_8_21_14_2_50_48_46]|uniref:Heme-copper oxidase subunit III family profile domain-containing protein n=1 Tax=bacterium (Candidatus Blackallbacteria) CG17_big_fil_post_rev_8_21_14_2_50_48_46 TaxID=2014261 RepID=A0A2M7G2Q0_9BACT|nr:MAG: hypothetical protein COW64_08365 [bacterium (Candidatus Blackallbacteria) CG18_big_fil_WC_8_21_14_2_50_49_26]PIW15664.1 MAG: hypothetical protein COW36_16370 [bacterium (Candidatus Blackallbacteria) CG17_big_fil_post_rev_8_21_14_2_50_48_46]PIW47307.1 MAG: hypothetical protein COW20_13110 [bacterium (Candidatus Blackallbacteria) CG13_big_fil_rev_8_21_14_2_50_49_14]
MHAQTHSKWYREISAKFANTPSEQAFLACLAIDAVLFVSLIGGFYFNLPWENQFWPPPEMPVFPFSLTLMNGFFLAGSLIALFLAFRSVFIPKARSTTPNWLGMTVVMGLMFVLSQGIEWSQIFMFGLKNPLNLISAFFYPLIGIYLAHLLGGLTALTWVVRKLHQDAWMLQPVSQAGIILGHTHLTLVGFYWFFIVTLWPVLYYLLYIN